MPIKLGLRDWLRSPQGDQPRDQKREFRFHRRPSGQSRRRFPNAPRLVRPNRHLRQPGLALGKHPQSSLLRNSNIEGAGTLGLSPAPALSEQLPRRLSRNNNRSRKKGRSRLGYRYGYRTGKITQRRMQPMTGYSPLPTRSAQRDLSDVKGAAQSDMLCNLEATCSRG